MKANHDVGNLDACVVDVILDFDGAALSAHHTDECIAQYGVAQMADVRRFIGINVGVFDDDLAGVGASIGAGSAGFAGEQGRSVRAAIEADVDVAVAGHFHGCDARNRADVRDEIGGDLLRRLFEGAGQLEGDGYGDLAERRVARLLQRDGNAEALAESRLDLFFQIVKHGNLSITAGRVHPAYLLCETRAWGAL